MAPDEQAYGTRPALVGRGDWRITPILRDKIVELLIWLDALEPESRRLVRSPGAFVRSDAVQ
jgi:hypothetical protein